MTRKDAPFEGAWVRCPATSKRGYHSKTDARKARGRMKGNGVLSVFRCEHCDRYHLGHLPPSVRNGEREKKTR